MSEPDDTYLIVGLKGLVLLDVTGIIEEVFPNFAAITAHSALEATALAATLKSVRFALLDVDPDEFVRTELASRLSELGTRIVMMGRAAEENAPTLPYDVLERPFIGSDVIRLLKKER